ncbi:sterol desaturase family protein [Cohnella caldifontis]|uniref:sterol desaturase family protein n=1 Tax=Cohnella caldifontis TaxID=3027471 RepID=UPI0023EDAA35|nr:sterol desaturase family protein [Cohnella sp. YIM B05605]
MGFYKEFYSNGMIRFVTGVFAASAAAAACFYDGWLTWVAAAAGVVLFALFEYAVHRYLLHQFPRIAPAMYAGHEAHHQDPNDIKHLFGPVHYDIIGYVLVFGVLLAASGSLPITCAAVAGISLMQLYYQWMHYASHRPVKLRTPWSKWMKKKHLLHHHMDDHAWYGVSNPVLDYFMGTWKPIRRTLRKDNPPSSRPPHSL